MPVIAAEQLRRMIAYNPETGDMTWIARTVESFPDQKDVEGWNSRHAGLPALSTAMPNGRKRGDILGRGYYAHRVAWAIHHGAWPTGEIDHINGDPSDNRIANLRDVDRKTNCRNMSNRRSGRGRTGVYYRPGVRRKKPWVARLWINGKGKNLGYYATEEEAISARLVAERENGFHENHARAALSSIMEGSNG